MDYAHPASVVHLELHTPRLGPARAFYEELCGWRPEQIETRHGSYLALETGSPLGAGIVECQTRRPIWLPYVKVPDVNASTEAARLLGAAVLLDAREGPAGWRAVIATPTGGELAFWQPKA
jgi:predicted enzyme related to lactoylglutathione lyase